MKKLIFYFLLFFVITSIHIEGQNNPKVIILNGIVEFDQTTNAFPPKEYTRKIQVPGLIDLAIPKIDQYEKYFNGTHEPRYSWYKFTFNVDSSQIGQFALLKILKSRYDTQIILNGFDCGTYMQCNTPIEADLTNYIIYNDENVLLVRLGERAWLPKESATGFDREKFTDIPGIWDDIFISFSGPIQINRALVLPNIKDSTVTVKLKVENLAKILERNMEFSVIEYSLSAFVREKKTKEIVSEIFNAEHQLKCQQMQQEEFKIKLNDIEYWSHENPALYETVISVTVTDLYFDNYGNPESLKPSKEYSWLGKSDEKAIKFGMREFEASGKNFLLNGEQIKMFGSSLTLNRFFEDRSRSNLPWDKEWVEKLMVKIPKALGWNTFRVSVGLLPSFWYDLADEHGFLIQNEYPMWNLRGRDSQLLQEYTDWVWTDGNHPSIVIWDALNEQKQSFIGNELLPKLRKLDPTRIWDAGWMEKEELSKIEMREIHWYTLAHGWWSPDERVKKQREKYRFGNLFSESSGLNTFAETDVPMILNEYGWLWLNRDGEHSAIRTFGSFSERDQTPIKFNYEYYEPNGSQLYSERDIYNYYVGSDVTPNERWEFQAYLLGIETEVARASKLFSGVISFSYLTNDGGHTGDWFKNDIVDLVPTQGLLMQYHSMKPFAVFIDLEDGRYNKNPKSYEAGSKLAINLIVLNDSQTQKKGIVELELIDENGNVIWQNEYETTIKSFEQKIIPTTIKLPNENGGYMLISKLSEEGNKNIKQVSRRYVRVGKSENVNFYNYEYESPNNLPE